MAATLLLVLGLGAVSIAAPVNGQCDTTPLGYQCSPDYSHNWGQYSPYFTVPGLMQSTIPCGCTTTFAQVLSRHGARDPTASKTKSYNTTIVTLQSTAKTLTGKYAFLKNYTYTLGADQLTTFGQQEMVNSGTKFFNRYVLLAKGNTPFVRSSSEDRVVVSGQNFTQGFHAAKIAAGNADPDYPYPAVILSENAGQNNTLNHLLCTQFETGQYSTVGSSATSAWANVFVPPIRTRINADLGANLTQTDIISLMDLCPFVTVASAGGNTLSPFCGLFTAAEFTQYNYYYSLNKYYGYGAGNPLGPTQGVGWTNELIARLTSQPVMDNTSTNKTLDSNSATFPLGKKLYADFSHDNDMTGILFALGLYSDVQPLSTTSVSDSGDYSAASTVSFASRIYVEKMTCDPGRGYQFKNRDQNTEELVRILVNDKVVAPLKCTPDSLGRCRLSDFVNSLSFAKSGGYWNYCFNNQTVPTS